MKKIQIKKKCILALGAESIGIFAVFKDGDIFISDNFSDLFDENNFLKYKKAVLSYLGSEKIKPAAILTDLHPLFRTTLLGEELAKKYKVKHIKVQHHIAHIFSAVGDCFCHPELVSGSAKHRFLNKTCPVLVSGFGMTDNYQLPANFFGLAMDGTGYGLDGSIWGGEIFKISNDKFQTTNQCQNPKFKMKIKRDDLHIERAGSLEEQIMIGGDLAVREPARMLISILTKIPNSKFQNPNKFQIPKPKQIPNSKTQKDLIYKYIKKFYTRNEFEVLYNQREQNFNCQKTTSTGRVLDAVSVLLGFAGNERNFKHEATKKLEENSSKPYGDIELRIKNHESRKILDTTYLFEYLLKNINRDKRRLAATAQLYIAKGLHKIIQLQTKGYKLKTIFAAGGMANNKIISEYLEKQGVYISKKIPRGDEGIAAGQIVYCLENM